MLQRITSADPDRVACWSREKGVLSVKVELIGVV